MPAPSLARVAVRFAGFEIDFSSGELRKHGSRVKLQEQPFQVLAALLEDPGKVVTREALRQRLWPCDTFVDFDDGLNTAVRKLREALGDSAENSRFIETVPRRGYRFIHPVEATGPAPKPEARETPHAKRSWKLFVGGAISVLLLALAAIHLRDRLFPVASIAPVRSVSVLPFRNLTGDANQEFLADGVTDALTTELAQTRKLIVPSVTSAMYYKGAQKKLPDISRELDVEAVIEGSVQRSGGKLQVNVQLIDAKNDRHLWARTYDQDADASQALLRRISADLIDEMGIRLSDAEVAALRRRPTAKPEAVEAFLKGRYHLRKGTEQDRAQARDLFQSAIELDPSYAAPYAELAALFAHGGAYLAGTAARQSRTLTRQLAQKALEIDPSSSTAHRAVAWVAAEEWDWETAEREYKTARELNPNDASAWYAQFLGYMRRFDEAIPEAQRVMRLDPASPDTITHAAYPYFQAGRVNEAVQLWRQALELDPNYWAAHQFLGRAFLVQRSYPEAIAEIEKSVATRGIARPADRGLLAYAYAKSGDRDRALRLAQQLEQNGTPMARVFAFMGLGDHDRVFQALDAAYSRHGALLFYINSEPLCEELYTDPRYLSLMRRVGFPETALQSAVAMARRNLLARSNPAQ